MSKTLGKDYESRQLSKKVRDLALEKILLELEGKGSKDKRFQQALLLKLAGCVLPRLNEVTGADGQPLIVQISETIAKKHDIDPSANSNSK